MLIKRRLFITFHRKNIKYVRNLKSHNWPLEILQEQKKHVFLFVIKITILYGIDLHAKHVILRADVHDITDRSTGLRYVTFQANIDRAENYKGNHDDETCSMKEAPDRNQM